MSPTRTGSFTRRAVRPIGVGECAENGSDVAAAADLGCSQLSDLIFIGGRAIASDRGGLASRGINRVVNMATECENFFEADGEIQHVRCTDRPDDEAFGPAVDDIVAFVDGAAAAGGNVLVHCNSGISRSTAAVLACLVKRGACRNGALESCGMSLLGALAYVKERRPIASPHPAYMTQLCAYEVRCHGGSSSLNEKTYRNNRYEDVAKLGSDKEDPRGQFPATRGLR
ncbi:protein-tyrosine phosphatase-like protein [Pelagophyceae sp. CCMP2097]|nr:protein-tyrosine phosphatase-like protein [Pelagophyceae sp. CCMP2097]